MSFNLKNFKLELYIFLFGPEIKINRKSQTDAIYFELQPASTEDELLDSLDGLKPKPVLNIWLKTASRH